jgi:DNA-binding GntR family transcriptional regulator
MVLWVKSPRVASSDCASNPMPILIRLKAPYKETRRGWQKNMDRVVQKMVAKKAVDDEDAYIALDNEFHHLVFEHAGNDYLTASYTRYVGKIAALRKLLSQLPKHTDLSFDEHQCLAEAVRKGDLTEIKALLAEHIDRTRKAYKTATGLLQKSDH